MGGEYGLKGVVRLRCKVLIVYWARLQMRICDSSRTLQLNASLR
jgi:hypothetical protein